jgi:hypothetical protein
VNWWRDYSTIEVPDVVIQHFTMGLFHGDDRSLSPWTDGKALRFQNAAFAVRSMLGELIVNEAHPLVTKAFIKGFERAGWGIVRVRHQPFTATSIADLEDLASPSL